MKLSKFPPRVRPALVTALALALGAASGVAAAGIAGPPDTSRLVHDVREALKLRLPRTPIDSLICDGFGSLCEVVSKKTLFYVDRQARFLMVGRLYDMESRQDLTAARLLALNPDLLAAGGLRRETDADAEDPGAKPEHKVAAANISLAGLPANGAITWGPESGPRVVVFSDFHCGYCKRLSAELEKIGARVEERPISIFGADSRRLSEQVLCAADRPRALRTAYAGESLTEARRCDTSGLDANEAFARTHGFAGTPVIVRPSDGAVLEGFRPAVELTRFLKGAAK
ncbi:MAG: DsbC family protein [Novosphingobium sp.]